MYFYLLDSNYRTTFSLMEILPRPLGVVTSTSTGSSSSTVAVSGTVSGLSGLTTGKMYYTTTNGILVADSNYYGRDGITTSAAYDEFEYVVDTVNNVIVTQDSQVGLAVASDTLQLRIA